MIAWLAAAALAQSLPQGVPNPDLDAQIYRPPIDSKGGLLWTDTARGIGEGFSGRAVAHYAHRPFAFQPAQGEPVVLLSSVATLDLIGAYAVGPVRFGVDVPVLYADGALSGPGVGLGDVALDARVTAVDSGTVGVGLSGRLGVPSTTVAAPVGTPGLHGEVAALFDVDAEPILFAANVGMLFQPATELVQEAWDEQLAWRVGAAYAATDAVGVTGDVAGAANLSTLGVTSGSAPTEALVGAYGDVSSGVRLQLGVGRGLTPGIGSSQLRVVAALVSVPNTDGDPDGDGLVGAADACPREAEDRDGVRDSDGCPDLALDVVVTVTSKGGGSPEAVQIGVEGGSAKAVSDRTFTVAVDDQPVSIQVSARGHESATRKLQPGQPEATIALEPRVRLGVLQVEVRDAEGSAVPKPRMWVDGTRVSAPHEGVVRLALTPGAHRVLVAADGLGATYLDPSIDPGADAPVSVVLTAPLVTVEESTFVLPRPLSPADGELVRAVAATAMAMEVAGLRLIGDPEKGQEVLNLLVAAGMGRATITTVTAAEAPPLDGTYDVQLAE